MPTPTIHRGWLPALQVDVGSFMEPLNSEVFGFEATTAGTTGLYEPNWQQCLFGGVVQPTVAGGTITDGTVVWTARTAVTITWQASPIYKTGPVTTFYFPAVPGATVIDGSVQWTARTPVITDSKCPHSKIAIAMSQKVFSPYNEVMRYSATNLPRDWSTEDDAGFLPTGMHAPKSSEVTAVGEYRGRLVVFMAASLQIWTTDPDPLEQALFDNIEGIGTAYRLSIASVAGDLFFLTTLGVRTLAIAAGSTNLQAGDIGTGIDELVQAKLAGPNVPFGFYYPQNGQYWLVFGNEAYVYSQSKLGRVGAWSRYTFPWTIKTATTLNGVLYFHVLNAVYRVDEAAITDGGSTISNGSPIVGTVWFPYLDLDTPGKTKMLHSVDVVGLGTFTLSIGYNQNSTGDYTAGYLSSTQDTVPGSPIAIPLMAPSFALRLVYSSGQDWQLNAIQVTFDDMMGQP